MTLPLIASSSATSTRPGAARGALDRGGSSGAPPSSRATARSSGSRQIGLTTTPTPSSGASPRWQNVAVKTNLAPAKRPRSRASEPAPSSPGSTTSSETCCGQARASSTEPAPRASWPAARKMRAVASRQRGSGSTTSRQVSLFNDGRASGGSLTGSGTKSSKVAPLPSSLATASRPPIRVASRLQMASPSPTPEPRRPGTAPP